MDVLATLRSGLADRYAIERELGQGGMATVYLARDLKHDRKVTLKVLGATQDGGARDNCDREMDFESLRGYAPFDELLRPKG